MNNDPCQFSREAFDQAYWELYFCWIVARWGYTSFFTMQCLAEESIINGDSLPPEVQ